MNQPPKKLSSSPIVINTPQLKTESRKQDCGKVDSNYSYENLQENNHRQGSELIEEELRLLSPREYERISIRILKETKTKLLELKLETGIPYEILIEVLVGQWDELSNRTQKKIVRLGQIERNQRLAEGQQKSMKRAMERLKK